MKLVLGEIQKRCGSTGGCNGQRFVVESTINAIKLRSLFNTIVTLDDVAVRKPAPDLFLLAAEKMGVPPYECIVYEDSDGGLKAARRAGMRSY